MPRLSKKQLRLIFAKLKLRREVQASRARPGKLLSTRNRKSILVQHDIAALISRRIPKHHQTLSEAKTVKVHSSARSMESVWKRGNTPAGIFDRASGTIHVRVDTAAYAFPVGYTDTLLG